MSDRDQIESQPAQAEGDRTPAQSASNLGATLKGEREKRNLTLDQIASMTKLRRRMLEALENEEWGALPPSIFVRASIRAYAKVLDLDAKSLLDLYERVAPAKAGTFGIGEVPHRSYKGGVLIALVLLLILGFVFYMWQEDPSSSREASREKRVAIPEKVEKGADNAVETGVTKAEGGTVDSPSQGSLVPSAGEPGVVQKPPDSRDGGPAVTDVQVTQRPRDAEVQKETVPYSRERPDAYVLKGTVVETTWMRISIDNDEPQEYIFQPGSKPQWKAKEGFVLMVGNAAGIEFDFNGKKLGKLGNLGKVVRLKLPEGFKPTRSED